MGFKKITMASIALSLLFSAPLAQSEELTGTLKKISDSGVVVVGHRESSVPFSYYNIDQTVIGYSMEYSDRIVEAIKKKLGKDIKVKLVPVTSQNRIPLLQNQTYDFECGSTTNNLERQKQVDFTNSIFIIEPRLIVNKKSGIKDFDDLKGKNVSTTTGTTEEQILNSMNDEKNTNIRIISGKDHGNGFRAVESGRASAFFMDDVLLAGERAKSKNPEDWIIVGTAPWQEAYGCMVRKGDTQFKALADEVIATAQTSGDAEKWYNKWFMSPIPPKNYNMNFELSDALKKLFKNPNDKAFQ